VEKVSDKERFHLRAAGPANVEITVVGLKEFIQAVASGNEFYRRCIEEGSAQPNPPVLWTAI